MHTATRRLVMILWDCASWLVATALIVGTRYEFYLTDPQWTSIFLYAAIACALQVVSGTALKLYRGRYRVGAFDEAIGLAASTLWVAVLLGLGMLVVRGSSLPPSSPPGTCSSSTSCSRPCWSRCTSSSGTTAARAGAPPP
ncbi:hypothetical protein [Georgenia sp. SUBG003]|uniref:hypothetical protein n=1 Tax=Georgenia sp. SUBG003 TaxID=1497974 RepID=UPI003AB12692